MTRKETLDIINRLNKKLDSMTDEELYEHMMKTSPSFRHTIEEVDKWVKAQELKEDKIFDEYGNYKFNWVPKHTPTDVSTTGGRPLSEQLMDLGIIDGNTVKPTPKMDDLKSNFHNPFQSEGHWTSDNKTGIINPDAVDNKTDYPGPRGKEKITPIEIKIEHISPCDFDAENDDENDYEDETDVGKKDEKFRNICLNGDIYCKIVDALDGYISLIHDNICGLVSYRFSNAKDVLELAEKLVKAEDTLNLVRDTFRPDTSNEDGEDSGKKDDIMKMIKDIINKIYENKGKEEDPETMFANPKLVKQYNAYMARNVFTNTDGDKDDN